MPVFEYGMDGEESSNGFSVSLSDDDVHDVTISDSGPEGRTVNRMTIPKAVADEIGVEPGDSVLTRATDEGQIIVEPLTK